MRILSALLMAIFLGTAQAQELGRLFFTPEQRAALDARRKARVPDKPAAAVVASPVTKLDGFVQRSSGVKKRRPKSCAWTQVKAARPMMSAAAAFIPRVISWPPGRRW